MQFSASRMWQECRGAIMDVPELEVVSEDAMDSFLEKFQSQSYRGRFIEDRWEEEFEKIPLFMKETPSEIDPKENPDLACLQSIIFDDERSPEEQAKTYKDEGNDYFKEKNYKKAVISYTEGLKKKCADSDLNVVLYTNRAAAQYYLGNLFHYLLLSKELSVDDQGRLSWPVLFLYPEYAQSDFISAFHEDSRVLGSAGALCHLELKNFADAVNWCDKGLQINAKEKKLLELRAKADKLKRTEQRDIRKAKLKEKKEQNQNEALLQAVKQCDEGGLESHPSSVSSPIVCKCWSQVTYTERLLWLKSPTWYFVKALTPAFLVCVGSSSFCRHYLQRRKVHQVK
ncbi:PREDICTED: tetratricopeptide repeat protein 4 [Hipposideros armiger]|uniref:Tetratricopeptide repeat protein 4 n=1 Tax=Hipposideros armiger TaxID=186990 RepID=A0A8B7Q0V4_HIPAR|nr:PREDICTED: tetratricopeptide repeat protein 4 [Hipposideros armiger]